MPDEFKFEVGDEVKHHETKCLGKVLDRLRYPLANLYLVRWEEDEDRETWCRSSEVISK